MTGEQLKELLPSGRQKTFENRVGWARTYLKKAGLLDSPRHGYFVITERGRRALSQNPPRIDCDFLKQYPEFVAFRTPRPGQEGEPIPEEPGDQTPEESIEVAYQRARQQLATELLQMVSPALRPSLSVWWWICW